MFDYKFNIRNAHRKYLKNASKIFQFLKQPKSTFANNNNNNILISITKRPVYCIRELLHYY